MVVSVLGFRRRAGEQQAGSAPWDPRARPGGLLVLVSIAALAGVLGFALRIAPLVQGGGIGGIDGYDDGVYYAASAALVHGRLPYRDFLLLHPPGIVLALTPFAALGSVTADPVGVAAARVVFVALGASGAVLATVAGARFGLPAAAVAGLGYAIFRPAVLPDHSTLLEPLADFAVLVALVLHGRAASRFGPLLSGAAAGFAAAVRIWYAVPALVLAAFTRRPHRRRYLLGMLIGAGLPCLPFFLAAPAAMTRMILLDQSGRPRAEAWTPLRRLGAVLGATEVHGTGPLSALQPGRATVVLLLVAAVLTVAACTVPEARVFPAMLLAGTVVLLVSPSFYDHYPALVMPPLLLTAGVGVQVLTRRLPRLQVALPAAVLLGMAALSVPADLRALGTPFPAAVATAAQRVHGCVQSDDPSALAAMNVLSSDLTRGCAVWPDLTGYTLDRDLLVVNGRPVRRSANPGWQRDLRRYLGSGSAVVVHQPHTGLAPGTRAELTRGAVLASSGGWMLHALRL